MKKKILAISLGMAMAASLLAGCGSSAEETTAAATEAAETETEAETEAEAEETEAEETEAEAAEDTEAAAEAGDEDAEAGGTLIVGFDQDFPPMGFIGDDGEYTGFDLELAQEVASRLGLEYKPQPIAWDAKDMELESGSIDCIWNGFTMEGREDD